MVSIALKFMRGAYDDANPTREKGLINMMSLVDDPEASFLTKDLL